MKNIIKISLVTLALLLVSNVSAQLLPMSMGIKGGVNMSNIDTKSYKSAAGFNAGLTVDLNLPAGLAIMSGLEVTTKGAKGKEFEETINAMYLQFPIHLGYKMNLAPGVNAHFDLGPYFAQGIGGKTKGEHYSEKINTFGKDNSPLKKFDWGLGIGVGVTFLGKIQVRAGYDHGIANVGRTYEVLGEPNNMKVEMKAKNRNVYLSAGLLFF